MQGIEAEMSAANCLPLPDPKAILLVYERDSVLERGQQFLAGLGHQTDVVNTAEKATCSIYQGHYDMILVDLDVQQTGGIVLSARTWGVSPNIPIVVLSEWRDTSPELNVGGVWFMPKSCSFDQLSKLVGTMLVDD
jgi:DNA-binding NtrC family response regulator